MGNHHWKVQNHGFLVRCELANVPGAYIRQNTVYRFFFNSFTIFDQLMKIHAMDLIASMARVVTSITHFQETMTVH